MTKIRVERIIDVPRAWIWGIVGSFDKSPSDSFSLEITREGDPSLHGVGTERVLISGNRKVHERIIGSKPEEYFEYEILSGMPVEYYQGRAEFHTQGSGTRIVWSGEYESKNFIISFFIGHAVKRTINKTIDGLRDQYRSETKKGVL